MSISETESEEYSFLKIHKDFCVSSINHEKVSFERQSQINIILRVLHTSLNKLRISLILPKIFENHISARKRLNGSQYLSCVNLMDEYIKEENINTNKMSANLNDRLIEIIEFFHQNINVLDYFNDYLDDGSPYDKSFVATFQLLFAVSEQRLRKSAISELKKEKKIHEVRIQNEKVKTSIKVLQSFLKSRHFNFKWKQAVEDISIQKYEQDLAKCRYENNIKIKQEIIRSSRHIREILHSSATKQKDLEEELEGIRFNYENLLKRNLQKEKSAREEKNKLLHQLQTLLKKFDTTMGNKSKEKMDLQEEYKERKNLFHLFLVEYESEGIEYQRIVRIKEEEEKRKHEHKLLLFMMNRAAQVIQKHWRKFSQNQKKATKKKKKLRKS